MQTRLKAYLVQKISKYQLEALFRGPENDPRPENNNKYRREMLRIARKLKFLFPSSPWLWWWCCCSCCVWHLTQQQQQPACMHCRTQRRSCSFLSVSLSISLSSSSSANPTTAAASAAADNRCRSDDARMKRAPFSPISRRDLSGQPKAARLARFRLLPDLPRPGQAATVLGALFLLFLLHIRYMRWVHPLLLKLVNSNPILLHSIDKKKPRTVFLLWRGTCVAAAEGKKIELQSIWNALSFNKVLI